MGTRGEDDRTARRARPRRKELRRALCEAVEGFRALERDVEVDGRRAADVLGVDDDGRAWLAVLARSDQGAACALEALALARGGAPPLERLLRSSGEGAAEVDLERAPGVVVIAAADDAALVERLRPLVALGARLVTVSRLAGRSGAVLITRCASGATPDGAASHVARVDEPAGLGAFQGALPPAETERAALLLRRLARLDDALHNDVRERAVHISIQGRALCSLTAPDGRLRGSVASDGAPDGPLGAGLEIGRTGVEAEALVGEADVERFVEAVVGRYLAVAGGQDEDEDDGLGPLPVFETAPPRPMQLLSREEIEAFRD